MTALDAHHGAESSVPKGSATPRLWTPPLRPLTPDTSVGFDQIEYARDVLGRPLLPWQEFAVIHAGELLPDGRPRFRIVLIIVARQNGKTEIPVVLAPWWMFVDEYPLIVGTSTKLEYAKETWDKTRKLVQRTRALDELHPPGRGWYVRGNNAIAMWTNPPVDEDGRVTGDESRYMISAANEEGGRSLTIDRAVADELRQHKDYSAWNAMDPAASPEHAQIWCLSNAGDDSSVVLNDKRAAALAGDNYRLGIFEWSAPEDADPEDVDALLQANPRVGHGRNLEDLLMEAKQAKATGGQALSGFKTEYMCIRVRALSPAIDPEKWRACYSPGTLASVRSRVVLVVDVSLDGRHATAVAAAKLPDGRVRVEVVAVWPGAAEMEAALPVLVAKVKPRAVGWFPTGPAAAAAASLADRNALGTARREWPPRGVTVEAIRGELAATCMGLEKDVAAGQILHSGDPLLDEQITGAERLQRGAVWVFARNDEGHADAAYATAGAVHLARTLPPPVGNIRLVGPSEPG